MCLSCVLVVLKFSSGFEGISDSLALHDFHNTLYGETSQSNAQYYEINPSDTQARNLFEVASSAAVGQGYPHETPVPLASFDCRSD